MKLYRFLSLAVLVTGATLFVGGQAAAQPASRLGEALAQITENPDRAATNMHSYEFHPVVDTRTPKGYKAFYISHYGRHGSRYEQSTSFSKAALEGFRKADSLSLLTEAGKALYKDIRAITDEHEGMEGALTPRGGREHQMLARRMVSRFPTVFDQKDRKDVLAVASTSQRCIVSMSNFLGSLNSVVPGLTFTSTSASRYMDYINPRIQYGSGGMGAMMRRPPSGYDWTRFLSQIFKDPSAIGGIIPEPESFVRSVYSTGGLCQDLDFMGIDIFRQYFTPEELTQLWMRQNDMIYGLWANSREMGDVVRDAPKPLLKDFVEKADEALKADSHKCADLRFGHDTSVLPLAALMGVDDPDGNRYAIEDAHNHWFSHERVCMASNVQMIFYRNKKGNVLTKVLYNEQEVHFPGMKPLEGPYYPWETLRAWFLSLCQ